MLLISPVQQCESYVYVHTHILLWFFSHYGLSQDIDCSFLCNEALQIPVNNLIVSMAFGE